MSRKHSLPNVDEEALASLARQFPSMNVVPPAPREERPSVAPVPEPVPPYQAAEAESVSTANDVPTAHTSATSEAPAAPEATRDSGNDAPSASDASSAASPTLVAERSPAAPAAAPTVVVQRRGGRLLAALALLVALVALAASVSALAPPQLRTWLTQTIGEPRVVDALTGNRAEIDARLAATASALKQVQDRNAAIAARLEAIEAVGGSSNAAAKRVEAVEAAIKASDSRSAALGETGEANKAEIAKLSAQVGSLAAEIKDNGERIAGVEEGVKKSATATAALTKAASAERLFLTTLHLRSATQSASPFAVELAAVRAVAGDDSAETQAALKVLTPLAQSGVPTISELRDSFTAVVMPRVLAVSPGSQAGLGSRTKAWVQSIFVSRDEPPVGSDRNGTILTLAERSLAKGQLAAAVDQVVLLEDQASLVTTEWLKSASARLVTDKAMATLTAQAFDRLAVAN
jgi:hypothetical protein